MHALPVPRPATMQDLDALVALEQTSFHGDRLSRRQYRHHLASHAARILVMDDGAGDIAAAAVWLWRHGTRVARLYSLATAPLWRGHGLAARLVAAVTDAATAQGLASLRLEVRCDNTAAIALYQRLGFHVIGRREHYYEDGSDALRYEKPLRDAREPGR